MNDYKELCQWLMNNSSGDYRKSAEAANVIERLQARVKELEGGDINIDDIDGYVRGPDECNDLIRVDGDFSPAQLRSIALRFEDE